jgi:hypothetical protein
LTKDPLEVCLTYFSTEDFDTEQYIGHVQSLLDTASSIDCPPWRVSKEPLRLTSGIPPIPSLESPPMLELKHLPDTLKYPFLGLKDALPLIIASDSQQDQESSL